MTFCVVCSIMFCIGVNDSAIKWIVSLLMSVYSYVFGTFYFMYLQRILNLNRAVKKLVNAFNKDVANLLRSPGDLSQLDYRQKSLILVEAVNLIKNLLIRTYTIGYAC